MYMRAGMVLRSTILQLLQHRIGFYTPDATGEVPSAKSHIPTTQKVSTCFRLAILG